VCLKGFDEKRKAYQLSKCSHIFHKKCLVKCYKGYLLCPSCSVIYGIRTGVQPEGTMHVDFYNPGECPLEGYEKEGTIAMTFNFPNGVQTDDHSNPGVRYSGTQRTAFLPKNGEGLEVLSLFQIAFERRLLFTIGRSVTTGRDNTVIWNGIHMKTQPCGGSANFGFPDPTYFDRVKKEFSDFGVTLESVSKNNSGAY